MSPQASDVERPLVHFDLAGPSDDAELRRLLRENPVPGSFSLALTREPSFFHAAAVEGDVSQTVVARAPDGRLMGLGSRAVRTAFVNGHATRLGYLGQLRVDAPWRGTRGLLRGGFAGLERLHRESGEPALYVTTLIEGNAEARRALARPRPGVPTYTEREVVATLALPLGRRRRERAIDGLQLRAATASDLPDVAACLQRNLARLQFAPAWTADDLASPARCRGLSPGNFVLALRGPRLVGCVALWDQRAFKQTVVCGYPRALGLVRPLLQHVGPWLGLPRLPPVGAELGHAFLSHLAVDDDDPRVAAALVRRALNQAPAELSYVATALSPRHPLFAPLRSTFRPLVYRSVLFTVHWPDGAGAVATLDKRVPHLEVAVL